jgi:outer membrane protein assembly factor BamB
VQRSFGEIDTTTIYCGTAASPLVYQDNLIVQVGDNHRGICIAFDLDSGKEKWRWTGERVSYASPILAELEDVQQLVAHTNNAVVGLDIRNGKLLWKMPFTESRWGENIVTPVLYKDLLILSNGSQGATAVRVFRENDQWNTTIVWQNQDIAMWMSSPVINGDYLYGMASKGKGMFFCGNAATGKVVWSTIGDEGENAAILQATDVLFLMKEDGTLVVIKKSPEKFQQVASYSVADSSTRSHPVIWNNNVLVRDETNLAVWKLN